MQTLTPQKQSLKARGSKLLHEWKKSLGRYWQLYILLIPVVANFVIFHYVPMTGIQIAFKDFMLNLGTWGSEWIGFEHFERFFNAYNFWTILGNTLILSVVSLAFSFPLSVGLALLLNEIRHTAEQRFADHFHCSPLRIHGGGRGHDAGFPLSGDRRDQYHPGETGLY